MTEPQIGRLCGAMFGAAFLGLLAACAHAPTPRSPAPPTPAPVCVPVRAYDQAFLTQLAAQTAALPKDSPLAQAIIDYGAMRDAARAACSTGPHD